MARGAARRKEIAIRLSLGSDRQRLVRQLLTEGLVLSFAGGVAGLILAYWGMRLLASSFEAVIPFGIVLTTRPDVRVLAALLSFCLLSTLLFGFGPAWKCSRPNVVQDLKDTAGADLTGGGKSRLLFTRNSLVVGQLSLSLALHAVGVVPTLQYSLLLSSSSSSVSRGRHPFIYVPLGQDFRSNVHIHLRTLPQTEEGLAALLQAVRREIRSIDELVPILTLRTFRDHFDNSVDLWVVRLGARLFSLFGALALFLAAAGVYG